MVVAYVKQLGVRRYAGGVCHVHLHAERVQISLHAEHT